ncbi:LuxR C-terminal-related transcriptional regulator [Streptomyces bottropensis]|uniref:LuxR C-terminal-related transcriptional regulator n=1 Tax=Streptomyces bottropensis TaxID=42235 RepID=UPI00367B6B7C
MAGDTRAHPGNLPADLTSTVGRRKETAEVLRLLSGSRLVTVVGTGGVGKSRLALHVARHVQATLPDGAWLVDLAEVIEEDLLALKVLSTLPMAMRAGTGTAGLVDSIGDRSLLLLLDNCEHIIDVCAKLAPDLLRACPNLRILVTSREPLRIDGESVFLTPPLSVPEEGQHRTKEAADRYDAVRLFLSRASAADPQFSLTPDNQEAVLALCRRLDGLPLAIELAAARTRSMPVPEILKRLEDRFGVLTSGSRTAPPRHRTLLATVDHSHEQCSEAARVLWARMSVFAGGAGLDAVERVGTEGELLSDEVHHALNELVEKSIVRFDNTRYHMLETLHQYGLRRLRASGGEHAARKAHRDYFAGLAARMEAGWFGADQTALLCAVLTDLPNIRVALKFCLTEPGEARAGLRMAADLGIAWFIGGLHHEARHWIDRLLAADPEPSRERVGALWVNGHFTVLGGAIPAGLLILDECYDLAKRFDDDAAIANVTFSRGIAHLFQGNLEAAVACFEEAVRRERQATGSTPHLAHSQVFLGMAWCCIGRPDRAVPVLEEAYGHCRAHGEKWLLSWAVMHLGHAALLQHRHADAMALLSEALTRKSDLDDMFGICIALDFLGLAEADRGDAERATRLMGAATALGEAFNIPHRFEAWIARSAQYLDQARESLGPSAYNKALKDGRRLSKDQAVAYALRKEPDPSQAGNGALPLTPREREVAGLLTKGKTNKEIATELFITRRTVDTHVENILNKLGFTSRTQVAALLGARETGQLLAIQQ